MELRLKEAYRSAVDDYRRDDEIEARTDHHCWVWKTLADICASFGREISVLDAGCGTGRYFHCLTNVNRLVGIDLSPDMLAAARTPIRSDFVSAREIELLCESVHTANFPPESFDLIYSIGMFGYGCPLTVEMLRRFHGWLGADGLLFIDVSDFSSMPLGSSLRNRLRNFVYPLAPARVRAVMDERAGGLPFFACSRNDLRRLFKGTAFRDIRIVTRPCRSPCWSDNKLQCLAARDGIKPRLLERLG